MIKVLLTVMMISLGQLSFAQNMDLSNKIVQLQIDGPIGPATADYITRSLDKAAEGEAHLIIIRIDTPGGLDNAMRDIIKKIIASPVPVASFVAPSGARAASAGTYILYASHIAAMAPATNLGAATPVNLMEPGQPTQDQSASKDDGEKQDSDNKVPDNAMAHKAINDAVAYIRGLARMRHRNEEWAEQAVRNAASLSAEEALRLNVIDLIAQNQIDLLGQLHQRSINVLGQHIILTTENVAVEALEPDWRNRLLSVITDPNVAYMLMMAGIYGLFFEFYNPGSILPGTVGAICILLALYAFQVLPVNYAGIALILLGIALMTAEAFVPNIGVLGIGGVISFLIGSIILIDTDIPGFGLNLGIVAGFAFSSVLFFIVSIGFLLKSRHKPVVSGKEQLVGLTGEALQDFNDIGMIRVHSEIWRAKTKKSLQKHEKAIVYGIEGLTLLVKPEQSNTEE